MQRRASVRGYRKKTNRRANRRTSSPMDHVIDHVEHRRSSVYTTSSEEGTNQESTQEQIFENIRLHKEVIQSVKLQPWPIRKKLKLVRQAKTYVARHEGALQERFAMSRSTRDLWARFKILMAARWRHWKRETASFLTVLIPWELRIKEIESHFGSGVASYFTFLRWLMWVNVIIALPLVAFVIGPEYFATKHDEVDPRKKMTDDENYVAGNLFTIWEFEGYLKYSPLFYGYYSNYSGASSLGYKLPLAYFLTAVAVYIYSFVATLRKDFYVALISQSVFYHWTTGHAETAHNRIASVVVGFKEALLEEAEKKKDNRNWRIILQRILVNLLVMILLAASGYTVVVLVNKSEELARHDNWLSRNAVNVTMTLLSFFLPMIFEALGLFENWHPRQQLRLQLARIMILNLLNLYSLMFSFIYKINSKETPLSDLKIKNDTAANELANLTEFWKLLDSATTTIDTNELTDYTEDYTTSYSPLITTITESTTEAFESTTTAALLTTINKVKCYNITVRCSRPWKVKTTASTSKATTAATTLLLLNLTTTMITPDSPFSTLIPLNITDYSPLAKTSTADYTLSSYEYEDFSSYTTDDDDSFSAFSQLPSTTTVSSINDTFFEYYYDYFIGLPYGQEEDVSLESNKQTVDTNKSKRELPREQIKVHEGFENELRVKTTQPPKELVFSKFNKDRENFQNVKSHVQSLQNLHKSKYSRRRKEENQDLANRGNALSSTTALDMSTTDHTTKHEFLWEPNKRLQKVAEFFTTAVYKDFHDNVNDNVDDTTTTATTATLTDNITNIVNNTTTTTTIASTAAPTTKMTTTTITETNNSHHQGILTLLTTPLHKPQSNQQEDDLINDNVVSEILSSTTPYFIDEQDDVAIGGQTDYFDWSEIDEANFGLCIRTVCVKVPGDLYSSTTEMETTTATATTTTTQLTLIQQYHQNVTRLKKTFKEIERNLTSMCWETSLGQELSKVIVFDGLMSIVAPLCIDFLRALFVRYVNRNWCWDMEKTFPQYGDFKIAENILTLINNQGQVWMGIFFSPGLVLINLGKLVIMMYFRSWIVLTCNVPHEVVFKASKSNNFYLTLLLTMLFLCVLPVGYAIVWLRPSWHCGPFSDYNRISEFITNATRTALPKQLHDPLNYLTSSSTVIPLLLLLILIIYYLVSLTGALREANQDLRTQLQKEREEERKKIFKVTENKPSEQTTINLTNRWRKVLEASSPLTPTQPIDFESEEYKSQARKELITRIMKKALRKGSATSDEDSFVKPYRDDDDTDTEHHDSLPRDEEAKDKPAAAAAVVVVNKLQQIRKTRKPSLVDIVQIAKSVERERERGLAKELHPKSRFKVEKCERKAKQQTTQDNTNDPDLNMRIINERRASLMCRRREEERQGSSERLKKQNSSKYKQGMAIELKEVVVENLGTGENDPSIIENSLNNHNTSSRTQTKQNDEEMSEERENVLTITSNDDQNTLNVDAPNLQKQKQSNSFLRKSNQMESNESYKIIDEKSTSLNEGRNSSPPLGQLMNLGDRLKFKRNKNKPTLEPEIFKFETDKVQQLRSSSNILEPLHRGKICQNRTETMSVCAQNNHRNYGSDMLANFSRQGRKRFGSLLTLVRETVNNNKKIEYIPTQAETAIEIPTSPGLQISERTNFPEKSVISVTPIKTLPSTTYNTNEIHFMARAPLESPEDLEPHAYNSILTNRESICSNRNHTYERPLYSATCPDSQISNWSDNIPTITISPTGDLVEKASDTNAEQQCEYLALGPTITPQEDESNK
uniref:TMC domain-containing protein n=1 Tax=Glossina pallidipes TaxID=7398 RepID=A0A1A9ZKJ4_GLOPL